MCCFGTPRFVCIILKVIRKFNSKRKFIKFGGGGLSEKATESGGFTHFRKCLGSNQEFSWKGQPYLTLLAEEVENVEVQVADTTTVEKVNESDSEVVTR